MSGINLSSSKETFVCKIFAVVIVSRVWSSSPKESDVVIVVVLVVVFVVVVVVVVVFVSRMSGCRLNDGDHAY